MSCDSIETSINKVVNVIISCIISSTLFCLFFLGLCVLIQFEINSFSFNTSHVKFLISYIAELKRERKISKLIFKKNTHFYGYPLIKMSYIVFSKMHIELFCPGIRNMFLLIASVNCLKQKQQACILNKWYIFIRLALFFMHLTFR